MEKIVLIGNGGHAKSIIDSIETSNTYKIEGFIANNSNEEFAYRGYRIIGTDDDLEQIYESGIHNAFICIGYMGDNSIREELYIRLKKIGFTLPVIIDPSAMIALDSQIKEGTYIGKRAVINSAATIGEMSIINTGAVVEHDCLVGEFSHVAVNATLCGNVKIGRACLIGANAVILQNIQLKKNVLVGAGAVVLDDIQENSVVTGVPAKSIKKINDRI